MLNVLTARQMRRCDRAAIDDFDIPEIVLMENAGAQVVEAMEEFFDGDSSGTIAVCCGKGNNGGDGLVVARHLHNRGRRVRVYLLARREDLDGLAERNHRIATRMGVPVDEVVDEAGWRAMADELSQHRYVVDALLGTGLTRPVEGVYLEAVRAIRTAGAPVVAVDVPSGLSADTGELLGEAVVADLTVTFAAPKRCHVLPPAEGRCGELAVVDIGIPTSVLAEVEGALRLPIDEDFASLAGAREPDTHKGTYGRLLVVVGAVGTTGAAVLTGQGALRAGAGLVTVAVPEAVYPVVAAQLTEALVRPLPGEEGGLAEEAAAEVVALADEMDALALGPGLGREAPAVAAIRRIVDEVDLPTVLDADGLNAFADELGRLDGSDVRRVLTPHPGEMARLLGSTPDEVQEDRIGAVRRAAEATGAMVLLKGYRTLVGSPSGDTVVNPTGNAGMATGGSGDVLTGMIGGFLGQSMTPSASAVFSAYVHGRAGDLAAAELGERSLVAGDLLDYLPAAFESLTVDAVGEESG